MFIGLDKKKIFGEEERSEERSAEVRGYRGRRVPRAIHRREMAGRSTWKCSGASGAG